MIIMKLAERLTDGSSVFNLRLWDDGGSSIVLRAVSESDADALIGVLRTAVENHTTETVDVEG
jgi:hypothetical protein